MEFSQIEKCEELQILVSTATICSPVPTVASCKIAIIIISLVIIAIVIVFIIIISLGIITSYLPNQMISVIAIWISVMIINISLPR